MQHMTIPQIKQLLAAIPDARWRLMILVGFSHGLRVTELVTLTARQASGAFLDIKRLKGSQRTIQPYKASADPELDETGPLAELVASLKPADRLFPMTRSGVAKLMTRAGQRAGLPKHLCHPHVLKHSCAMAAIDVMHINEVQKYLGHSSLSSTGEYLKVSDTVAAKAFARAF